MGLHVVLLTLYNLQLNGVGKCGYFRWKDQICAFISNHWTTFFGNKKKTNLWYGTVAGVLSNGCPHTFTSGAIELQEAGWWRLTHFTPPSLDVVGGCRYKRTKVDTSVCSVGKTDGLRSRRGKTSIQSAMELKARRSTLLESKQMRKSHSTPSCSSTAMKNQSELTDTGLPHVPPPPDISACIPTPEVSPCPPTQPHSTEEFPQIKREIELLPLLPLTTGATDDDSYSSVTSSYDESMDVSLDNSHMSYNNNDLLSTNFVSDSKDAHGPNDTRHQNDTCSHNDTNDGSQITHDSYISSEGKEIDYYLMDANNQSIAQVDNLLKEENESTLSKSPTIIQEVPTQSLTQSEQLSQMFDGPDSDIDLDMDLDIDPVMTSPLPTEHPLTPTSPSVQDMLQSLTSSPKSVTYDDMTIMGGGLREDVFGAGEGDTDHATGVSDMAGDGEGDGSVVSSESESEAEGEVVRRRRRVGERHQDVKPVINYTHMSEYEETKLLERLCDVSDQLTPELRRFRRKLLVRKEKRNSNLPIFDLDQCISNLLGLDKCINLSPYQDRKIRGSTLYNIPVSHGRIGDVRVLDRYQMAKERYGGERDVTFHTRLVGRDDKDLKPVRSPYTTRLLKPFIRRDTTTRPLKLRLLYEIIAYPHRHDPHWIPPSSVSIDYCYVRPEHIPSVNSLCRTFFWPGIDLSECLHYPDFSCVVLYRKVVIAFAFMVPDLAESRHNEAYISFVFTHPEWRGEGIASFMVYHLIQTCMGKDLTLHVAADNPAMLLYQKFGFKPEEYIVGFYDKYYPVSSGQSMNAFFLRLPR